MRCEDCKWCKATKYSGCLVEWNCLKADSLTKRELESFENLDANECKHCEPRMLEE